MREAAFIKQNREKWQSYEEHATTDADELAERYVELTDDLSYANTFYPKSNTALYLNNLTSTFHHTIYRNRAESWKRIIDFWRYDVPLTVHENFAKLIYAFTIFTIAACIGWLSAAYDDTFVRLILGDYYVNMTIENIEAGDPMAVYSSQGSTPMFLGITMNNIQVSILAFLYGLFFSLGTFYLLVSNGIMLGAFQYFFYKYNYLLVSLLTVWIHGVLEISSIIVAGAAGFCLGNSIIFPKTYSRVESFKRGTKSGLTLVAGCIPLFIIAGFLESFVTRHSTVSLHVSAAIIIVSIIFIRWYFVVYPFQLYKSQNDATNRKN